eukprot:5589971-Pleurochrysis_carterae.AAC.1
MRADDTGRRALAKPDGAPWRNRTASPGESGRRVVATRSGETARRDETCLPLKSRRRPQTSVVSWPELSVLCLCVDCSERESGACSFLQSAHLPAGCSRQNLSPLWLTSIAFYSRL